MYFVSGSPYSGLISTLDQLRSVTLLVTAGIVLAGLLVSIFLTKNIYSPLSTLFHKIMPGTNVPASGSPFIYEYKLMTEVFHSFEELDKSMPFVISRAFRTIRELCLVYPSAASAERHLLHLCTRGHIKKKITKNIRVYICKQTD
ncbi:hypothetical protein AMQ83_13255, partial [Paenibacillus riograndensis]